MPERRVVATDVRVGDELDVAGERRPVEAVDQNVTFTFNQTTSRPDAGIALNLGSAMLILPVDAMVTVHRRPPLAAL